MSGGEDACEGTRSIHVNVQGINTSELPPDHEANRFSEGIVPSFPFCRCQSSPNMGIVLKLADGSGLEDLRLGIQGHVGFIVKLA